MQSSLVFSHFSETCNEDLETASHTNHCSNQSISHNSSSSHLPSLLSAPSSNTDEVYSNEINTASIAAAGGGHHSDQSASEDSSLTDSDR